MLICLVFTSVDPVNATLFMSWWLAIAWPAVGPYPGTTLMTPSGNPAYWKKSLLFYININEMYSNTVLNILFYFFW